MVLLVMVLDDVAHLYDVLEAWKKAGIHGVTILESTGVNRVLTRTQPQSMFMGFGGMFGSGRVGHNTLFSVVNSMDLVEAAVQETETILGSLSGPHTGIIFTLPVSQAWGLHKPVDNQ